MKYTIFSGCSFTSGAGLNLERNEPDLWVNRLYNEFFSHTAKLNVSKAGRANAGIFQDTVNALTTYPVEYVIVQWTSMPRYELELGFEIYQTRQYFIPNSPCQDINTNSINYTSDYLNTVRDRFTSLAHDCYEIKNLLEYTNSIIKLSQLIGARVFFINGLCPWDDTFFNKKTNCLPNQYTKYTQKLLNVINRDDNEIYQLYSKLHDTFTDAGTINESLWLNLYSPMHKNKIDLNTDQLHPGIKSNNKYFELFSKSLDNLL